MTTGAGIINFDHTGGFNLTMLGVDGLLPILGFDVVEVGKEQGDDDLLIDPVAMIMAAAAACLSIDACRVCRQRSIKASVRPAVRS